MGTSANRNNLLAVRLLQVRRHFNTCRKCKSALVAQDPFMLCMETLNDLMFVAIHWESGIAGRLAVRRSGKDLLFLCPDLNAHGAAYAATAEPVEVHGIQGSLF